MKSNITGYALATETVMVDGGKAELQIYKSSNGSYYAVDGSYIEQCVEDGEPLLIPDQYSKGGYIRLIDDLDELKEVPNNKRKSIDNHKLIAELTRFQM